MMTNTSSYTQTAHSWTKVAECQSTTLHIELHAFLTHLQCISEALPHTLMHCVSDSACYTTLHHPLHLHLHMCRLCLFVCLFTFVTSAHVACLFVCFPFWIGSINVN